MMIELNFSLLCGIYIRPLTRVLLDTSIIFPIVVPIYYFLNICTISQKMLPRLWENNVPVPLISDMTLSTALFSDGIYYQFWFHQPKTDACN